MKRSIPNKSTENQKTASESAKALVAQQVDANPGIWSRNDSDQAVERGSQALSRHASRKHFAFLCRLTALSAMLLSTLGIIGYLVYPRIAQMPWQKYFDRFDFRLQGTGKQVDDGPKADTESSTEDS